MGPDMGLTVLLNLSYIDYFYPLKSFIGATAIIFDPTEFPDSSTGGVKEVPVEPSQEVQIALNMVTKVADEQVQRYGIDKRLCMFPTDAMDEYHGNYVYGDCLVKCKLRSVIALCKCKLYNFPTNFPDMMTDEQPFCSLAHLECLNKYRIKWQTYRPREFVKGLEKEMEDSLACDNCYPMCTSNSYVVDSTATKLNFYFNTVGSVM